MSNSGMSADYRGEGQQPSAGDGRDELKSMLDTIAAQLEDADRRHTAALNEMQDRISGISREADFMRPRVPSQFAPAFAQIEAGIGALAHRLADASNDDFGDAAAPQAYGSDPVARGPRVHSHGSAAAEDLYEPWDRQSADALAGVYRPAPGNDGESTPAIDEAWLESRFAEIARGIEHSLAHVRPETEISVLGQRIDQFERQFTKVFAGVATHDDLAAVRQIEAHMEAVVHHLEKTNDQLDRLNTLEAQLATVSKTLADMQAASVQNTNSPDIDAIARAVADETAQRFSRQRGDDRSAAADELRPLIEQLMMEHRQGGEHTAAILDTMQQAMVRLLDRIDAVDLSPSPLMSDLDMGHAGFGDAPRSMYPSEQSYGGAANPPPFAHDFGNTNYSSPGNPVSPPPISTSFGSDTLAQDLTQRSEKMRQDYVADIRRAKARLAKEGDEFISGPSTAPPVPSRPIRPASGTSKNSFGPSAPSPRLMIVAALVLLALAALWYTFGFGGKRSAELLMTPGSVSSSKGSLGGASDAVRSSPPDSPGGDGKTAAPDAGGPRGDIAPVRTTDGEKTAANDDAAPEPRTALPMTGVAVDLDQPVTQAELEQARRHQAMAAMSGQLGSAAGRPQETASLPASMVPSEAETEGTAPKQQEGAGEQPEAGLSRSAPLDMPAATVGPLSLRLAAANGDASAQFEVGARFAEGHGVKQSFKDAAKWYQRSADQGFAQAQYRLATLYERGLGLKPDREQAAALYERAAAQGNIKSMHNLAVLSANQTDRSPDYASAAHWFSEAAKRGLPDSQFNLAILYENGLGVDRDVKQAFMWLSLAARGGDADAIRRRDILRGKLSAQDIAETEAMISNWRLVPTDRAVNDAVVAGELWKKNPKNGVSG
ncbi:tetratricopeptide repeat protein [Hyphomicrobium sp.]|uniref:tetratricopeptide repeat protein n=1 Tax=Hyphomicrobium sp. TaxID=82 RepID=UPI0025C535B0|nr:SEL1-like repeat protein [Hyphomicrobium sp.]